MTLPPHLDHNAPLVALVRQLMAGATLKDRVRVMRYRRKRPAVPMILEKATTTTTVTTTPTTDP